MKRRLLTLLLTLVFCVTSVAPGFAMNADDLGGTVPAAAAVTQMSATDKISAMERCYMVPSRQVHWSAVWIVWKMMFMVLLPATLF